MALKNIVGALRDEEFWRDMGRNTLGIGGVGIEFGKGAIGEVAGGITGLGKLATGSSFEEAGKTMENVQDWVGSWYEPKNQETQDYMQSIGGAIQPLVTEVDKGATWLEDKTGGWIPRELTKGSALAALELSPLKFVPTGVPNALRRYDPNTDIGQTVPPRDALGYTPDNLNFNYGNMPSDIAPPIATTGGASATSDFADLKQPETTSPQVLKQPETTSRQVWGSPFEIQKELDNVRTDLSQGRQSPEMVNENVDSIQKMMLNWDDYVSRYNKMTDMGKPSTDGGRIISADDAKELDPTGKYPKDRSRAEDVHEVGSWFVKQLYKDKLALPKGHGGFDDTVLFTGGGTGTGKTTALRNIPEVNNKFEKAEIVYDTNLANFDSSVNKIKQALETGRNVEIVYVHRGIEDSLRQGAMKRSIDRMMQEGGGRTVPTEIHAGTHINARNTIEALQKEFAGSRKVKITIIDNSRGKGNAVQSQLDQLPKISDKANLKARLDDVVKEMHESGDLHRLVEESARNSMRTLSKKELDSMVNQLLRGFGPDA